MDFQLLLFVVILEHKIITQALTGVLVNIDAIGPDEVTPIFFKTM